MRKLSLSLAIAALVACGGDGGTGPAVTRNSPGIGTSTMRVTADIDASDVLGGFQTDYDVSLRDGLGRPITGATVTITNASLGALTLVETPTGSGDYFNTKLSFPPGDFRLSVTRGTDNVRDVILGGPGVHTITAPANGSVATAGQPLLVTWTVPSKAKAAEIETRDFGPIGIADLGSYTILGANNRANTDQRVQVRRYNEVEIGGGLPGSRLRVTVENTAQPINVR